MLNRVLSAVLLLISFGLAQASESAASRLTASLAAIEKWDDSLNAVIEIDPTAKDQARAIDQ
ncbi:MAG: hypothetical protein AAF197_06540, partial [Pseudomonadota bacterium]